MTNRKCKRLKSLLSRQATPGDREIIHKAAVREFEILERLDYPGIVKADPPTDCEYGPVLFESHSGMEIKPDRHSKPHAITTTAKIAYSARLLTRFRVVFWCKSRLAGYEDDAACVDGFCNGNSGCRVSWMAAYSQSFSKSGMWVNEICICAVSRLSCTLPKYTILRP